MGKIIVKNAVERKPGFLYYIDGEGNLCEAEMKKNKSLENKRTCDNCGNKFRKENVITECCSCYMNGWKKEFKKSQSTKKREVLK
jgi:hypothetical protein